MYAFFDFHKEKVNIFFELFYGAYRLTGLQAYRLAGLQAYRLTGLPSDCSTALPFYRSSVNLLAKKNLASSLSALLLVVYLHLQFCAEFKNIFYG